MRWVWTFVRSLTLEVRIFFIFGLVVGGACLAVLPPFITFDGPAHYWRAVQIEGGAMRAERYSSRSLGGILPERFATIVDLLWYRYWSQSDYGTISKWRVASAKAELTQNERKSEFTQTAIYSPVNYVFQCIGIGFAGLLTRSPLVADRLGCVANLIGYLVIVAAAIELLPHFRRGLVLVATSPLLLTQAASMSPDSINFAVPALVLAAVASLRFVESDTSTSKRIGLVLVFGGLTALLKPPMMVSALVAWLIPERHFRSSRRKRAILMGYTAFSVLVWWLWNRPYLDVEIAQWFDPAHPPSSVLKGWALRHPLGFIPVFGNVVATGIPLEWPVMFGYFGGWVAPSIKQFLSPLSVVFLVSLLGCSCWKSSTDRSWAAWMFAQSLILLFVISLTLWISYGTIGARSVPNFSGRYLFFIFFGFGAAWSELFHRSFAKLRNSLFWAGLVANALWLSMNLGIMGFKTLG